MPDPSIPDLKNLLGKPIAEWLGYGWLFVLAIWGGTVNYISRIRKQKIPFSIIELVGEWFIAGFAGVITAYFCYGIELNFYMTAAATGIAGHMGGRAIGLAEHWFLRKIGIEKVMRK